MTDIIHTDALTRLWRSSASLYDRFFDAPPHTSAQLRCLSEEVHELHDAAYSALYSMADGSAAVAEEAVDVIVTVMGVCMSRGVTLEQVVAGIERVAAKNDAKTDATHYVNANGKIARRSS